MTKYTYKNNAKQAEQYLDMVERHIPSSGQQSERYKSIKKFSDKLSNIPNKRDQQKSEDFIPHPDPMVMSRWRKAGEDGSTFSVRACAGNMDLSQFDSFRDFVDYMTDYDDFRKAQCAYSQIERAIGHNTNPHLSKNYKWYMGTYLDKSHCNVEKVLDKVRAGQANKDVLEAMQKIRRKLELDGSIDLSESVKDCKRKRRFTDDGGELDIDRVMEGSEDYWMQCKRDGQQTFVRIFVNLSISCDNATDTHANLLASGLITAEILEAKGYGVEIYVGCSGQMYDTRVERAWMAKVKDCTEHLDIERIASVGCSQIQRLWSFAFMMYQFNRSHGSCQETSDQMQAFMGADVFVGQQWVGDKQLELIRTSVERIAQQQG